MLSKIEKKLPNKSIVFSYQSWLDWQQFQKANWDFYQENERLVVPKHKASLQPVHTPEATITIRESSAKDTIRTRSSKGRSFHPERTAPALSDFPFSLDTMRVWNHVSSPPVKGLPHTIFNSDHQTENNHELCLMFFYFTIQKR